jgi:hypothetical protein
MIAKRRPSPGLMMSRRNLLQSRLAYLENLIFYVEQHVQGEKHAQERQHSQKEQYS